MLAALVLLIILALAVYFVILPVLRGLGAPAWLQQVVIGLAIIIAVIFVAQAFGIPTPALK